MNIVENLLVTAGEECAEIQQVISKSLRFGLGNYHPADATETPNATNIVYEFTQLCAMIEKLQEEGVLPIFTESETLFIKEQKLQNVVKYQKVSRECGTLLD